MGKGGIFLALTVLLIIAVFVYLFFIYTPPEAEPTDIYVVKDAPRGDITTNCELNTTCFKQAINNDCQLVIFQLQDPDNSSNLFDGKIIGPIFDRCEVVIKDKTNQESMRCNLPKRLTIKSIPELQSVCSGDLLDRILV